MPCTSLCPCFVDPGVDGDGGAGCLLESTFKRNVSSAVVSVALDRFDWRRKNAQYMDIYLRSWVRRLPQIEADCNRSISCLSPSDLSLALIAD